MNKEIQPRDIIKLFDFDRATLEGTILHSMMKFSRRCKTVAKEDHITRRRVNHEWSALSQTARESHAPNKR